MRIRGEVPFFFPEVPSGAKEKPGGPREAGPGFELPPWERYRRMDYRLRSPCDFG